MSKTRVSDGTAVLPPEARRTEIPYLVVLHLLGATVHQQYQGKSGVALELDGEFYPVSDADYDTVSSVALEVASEMGTTIVTPHQWMQLHRAASRKLKLKDVDPLLTSRRIAMLKDKSGAGYWRMVLPAKYLEKCFPGEAFDVDVTSAEVKFDHLLEYDTIFVQRLHDWESYYVLEKLKKAGKRIVYDMDDDIFNLTPDNPAFHVISRDNQVAAAECMKLVDCVTTTTFELQNRLQQVTEGKCPVVIPNALDPNDGWTPLVETGSPDEWQRIFWQGSATHEEDWLECIEAIDVVMQERDNVRLVLLGYLPKVVQQRLGLPHWQNRVEYLGFSGTETYFNIVRHLRAEVGIAPLKRTTFNAGKSPIKYVECSVIGMPTVASDTLPYSGVIEDSEDGWLCTTTEDWVNAIKWCLAKDDWRKEMIGKARHKVEACFNINETAKEWKEVLLPGGT